MSGVLHVHTRARVSASAGGKQATAVLMRAWWGGRSSAAATFTPTGDTPRLLPPTEHPSRCNLASTLEPRAQSTCASHSVCTRMLPKQGSQEAWWCVRWVVVGAGGGRWLDGVRARQQRISANRTAVWCAVCGVRCAVNTALPCTAMHCHALPWRCHGAAMRCACLLACSKRRLRCRESSSTARHGQ